MSRDELEHRNQEALDRATATKLNIAATPGARVAFDPDEAERAGAFRDDALDEADADAAEDGDDAAPLLPVPANDTHPER